MEVMECTYVCIHACMRVLWFLCVDASVYTYIGIERERERERERGRDIDLYGVFMMLGFLHYRR